MNPLVKRRNMVLQVILFFITFGIYAVYWFYVSSREMAALSGDKEASPTLWTVLLFVPIAHFYAHYKHAELFQKVSTEQVPKWVLFVLWIFMPIAVWFMVQMELNRRA